MNFNDCKTVIELAKKNSSKKMGDLKIKNLKFLDRGPYSLSISGGEILCLSGVSGAGKSVILRAIADLDIHEGEIFLNNINLDDFSGPEWRRRVMYVPAESQWWRETVREHLNELPDTEFLNQFGFDNDVLDWEIGRLSSGEKQKLALLRAFLLKPEALLLDEPTSSLDKGSVKKVEALIDKYVKNNRAATIWVSHDQDQINRASDSHFEIQAGGNMRQLK